MENENIINFNNCLFLPNYKMEVLKNILSKRESFSNNWIIIYARLIQYYLILNDIEDRELETKLRDVVEMNDKIEEFDDFHESNSLMEYTSFVELEKILDNLEERVFKVSK